MIARETTGYIRAAVLLVAVVTLVLAGCSSKSTLDEQGQGVTPDAITLSGSPAIVTSGGTAVMDAVVTQNGVAVPGQLVNFSVSPAGAGFFTPAQDTTDANGGAASVYTANTAGLVTITATVAGTSLSSSLQIDVLENTTDQGSVTLSTTATQLLANSADTSLITITVESPDSSPAPDSTVVKMVAGERFIDVDGNGYWTGGIDSLVFDANGNGEWDPIGVFPSSVYITGGAGEITIPYVSGSEPGTVYFKITVQDNGIDASSELSISLLANSNMTVNASKVSMMANGVDTSVITVRVVDGLTNPAPDGTIIRFAAGERFTDIDGNGYFTEGVDILLYDANNNGQWDAAGFIAANASIAGGNGEAQVDYVSGTEAMTTYIRATIDDPQLSGFGELPLLLNSTDGTVLLTVNPTVLVASSADSAAVTVYVTDGRGQPAPDGTVIWLAAGEAFVDVDGNGYWSQGIDNLVYDPNGNGQWDAYGTVPNQVTTAGGTGTVVFYYVSGSEQATVFIKATVSDVLITATAEASISVNPNSQFTVGSSTSSLLANGVDTAVITITLEDGSGNPAPDNTIIQVVAGEKFEDVDGSGDWTLADSLIYDNDNDGQWDSYGTYPSTVVTSGGTGTAVVNFIAGYLPTTVFFLFSANDNGITGSHELAIQQLPAGGTLVFDATPDVLTANGLDTSQVTITVRDGNGYLAADGVEIRLAAGEQFQDTDSSGYWTEGTDIVLQDIDNDGTWDANGLVPSTVTIAGGAGQAAFNYISGTTPGAAYIKATIIDPRISGGADFSIQLMSTQGSISVSASPTVIVADGADQSTITIVVRDILGDPVADGTMVKLVAGEWFSDIDQNGIWTPGIDNLVQDANNNGVWDIVGQVPASVTTGGGTGTAVFTYTAGILPQTAYIKMTIADPRTSGSRDYPIQLIPDTAIHSIFLMTDSIQIAVTQTGGIEVATLYATGLDARGNPVGGGVPIDFFMVDDPGGGAHLEDGTTGPVREYTNTMGVASTRVHSGTVSGTLRLRATHGIVLSNATQILISAGPPAYMAVGAWECNVDYWDNVGMFNEITAVVADQYMNPVNDSTVVYFTTDEGTMKSHEERTAFNEGIAKTDWISGNNIAGVDGVVWVYAETAGGTVQCSTSFFNTHLADTLRITGWETNLVADGEDKFTAFMTAVDLNGNPVVGGTEFKSDANYVRAAGGTFEDGCYSSDARITVTSKTLQVDASRSGVTDNGVGAIDYVDYWVTAGASTTMICSLLTGNAYTGTSKINGQNTAAPGEVVVFSVTIMDRYGNPLADHTVNATASGGVIAGASQTTDSYGEASGYEWTAPGAAGDYTITCTDTDPRGLIVETLIITVE